MSSAQHVHNSEITAFHVHPYVLCHLIIIIAKSCTIFLTIHTYVLLGPHGTFFKISHKLILEISNEVLEML